MLEIAKVIVIKAFKLTWQEQIAWSACITSDLTTIHYIDI